MDALTGALTAGAVIALAGGYFLWTRLRAATEEPMYHFRCPGCDRRLRYRARQVGHRGECSNCGQQLFFPHTLGGPHGGRGG